MAGGDAGEGCDGAQRLDKWLWYARLVKSRTLASRLVEAGKVRVNREKVVKPSASVKIGDVITASLHGAVRIVRLAGLGTRRGPAAEAQALYEDLTPAMDRAAADAPQEGRPVAPREPGAGRPTKRDRRRLEALRQGEDGTESR